MMMMMMMMMMMTMMMMITRMRMLMVMMMMMMMMPGWPVPVGPVVQAGLTSCPITICAQLSGQGCPVGAPLVS
eukprot:8471480-Karenia_brevis.AAC.1